jgi:hypothetical protein
MSNSNAQSPGSTIQSPKGRINPWSKAFALLLLAMATQPVMAQQSQNVELAPIECYWRTSSSSVHLGEVFTVGLTCGVIETASTTVVADQSRLDPDVLQLQPFEVIDGSVAPDLRTPTRRFFQYQYRVRYIGDEIGRDLTLPALTLTYRVQSRVEADAAAIESRERQYILPARPIRVLSLLPGAAGDIRDPAPASFEDIRSTRFTASVLRIVAWAFFALAAVVAIWALVRAAKRSRGHRHVTVRLASDGAILRGVARELTDVRRHRDTEGWSDALAARALAALRVAANYELARPVVQVPARQAVPGTGQLRVPGRWARGAVLLSGSTTPAHLARERQRAEAAGEGRSARLADLEQALTRFAAAAYGRNHATVDADDLDTALTEGQRAVQALRAHYSWLQVRLRGVSQTLAGFRSRAWARRPRSPASCAASPPRGTGSAWGRCASGTAIRRGCC